MSDYIACPNCETENDLTAQLCVHCGHWLNNVTDQTMMGTAAVELRAQIEGYIQTQNQPNQLASGEIALHLVEADKTIKLMYEKPILLGRAEKPRSSANYFVDFTDYEAYAQGVSRDHAIIQLIDGEYCIEDLSSSNGISVNGTELESKSLYSLENGDQIFLGRFAVIFYYG